MFRKHQGYTLITSGRLPKSVMSVPNGGNSSVMLFVCVHRLLIVTCAARLCMLYPGGGGGGGGSPLSPRHYCRELNVDRLKNMRFAVRCSDNWIGYGRLGTWQIHFRGLNFFLTYFCHICTTVYFAVSSLLFSITPALPRHPSFSLLPISSPSLVPFPVSLSVFVSVSLSLSVCLSVSLFCLFVFVV